VAPDAGICPRVYDPRVDRHELTQLATGERVISERIAGVRSVAIGFFVAAGARDEPDSRAGVSHFLEHLLFKGTPKYTAQEIAETFDELGGELNAATSRETTMVYARVPDNRLEVAVDVMADMVYRPVFAEVDSEREVVLEEIAMVEDTPHDLVHDLAAEAVFGPHPLGRPVIGRAEVIATVSRRALAAYHRRAYVGERLVVAAAGNVRHDQLVSLLEERRNGETSGVGLAPRKPVRRLPAPGLRFQRKDTEQYHVCLAAPGIASDDERRFAASILDAIVGGSASSRLFQEIREKRGMAYSVYSYGSQYSDTGQIGVYVGTRAENLPLCLEIAVAELADVAGGNVRPDELARAKENLRGRLLLSLESTSNRMTRLGKAVVTDRPLLEVNEVLRRLDAVSARDVAELAGELFAPGRLSAAGIGADEARFREAVAHVNPGLLEAA
jgi:predicted Zn-dependent peptidase